MKTLRKTILFSFVVVPTLFFNLGLTTIKEDKKEEQILSIKENKEIVKTVDLEQKLKANSIDSSKVLVNTVNKIKEDKIAEQKRLAEQERQRQLEIQRKQEEERLAKLRASVTKSNVPLSADLQYHIYNCCKKYGVSYELVLGLIKTESGFNHNARSSVGCYGLMQLHPSYFPSNLDSYGNVEYGVKYLSSCISRCGGNVAAGLCCYNAGHDTGQRSYSNKVISNARLFGYAG